MAKSKVESGLIETERPKKLNVRLAFSPEKLDVIRKDINTALLEVQKKHGVVFELGRMNYTSDSFTAKLSCEFEKTEQEKFESECFLYSLKPSDYLKEVEVEGEKYELIGFAKNSRTYPYMIRNKKTGKVVSCRSTVIFKN